MEVVKCDCCNSEKVNIKYLETPIITEQISLKDYFQKFSGRKTFEYKQIMVTIILTCGECAHRETYTI